MSVWRTILAKCFCVMAGFTVSAVLAGVPLPGSDSSLPAPSVAPPAPAAKSLSTPAPTPDADGYSRLEGHVLLALDEGAHMSFGESAAGANPKGRLTITVVMQRDDPAGFEQYLSEVYDPTSPNYRYFLTQRELTARFGPTEASYRKVAQYLKHEGFRVTAHARNRMTVTAVGTRTAAARAFKVDIRDFSRNEQSFYANTNNPAVPTDLAPHIVSIEGLSSAGSPHPVYAKMKHDCYYQNTKAKQKACLAEVELYKELWCALPVPVAGPLVGAGLGVASGGGVGGAAAGAAGGAALGLGQWLFCSFNSVVNAFNALSVARKKAGLNDIHEMALPQNASAASGAKPRAGGNGTGQVVGLVEFDAFDRSDVAGLLDLFGASSQLGNLSVVPVNGGVATPGAGESEVLIDIDTVMMLAPGAKVAVYESPFDGHAADYSAVFNAMINDGVTVISNSWASCEDQVSQADAQGIDAILKTAAASGVSVFNGTGDTGSTCVDGSANTISVPADSPNATAVGGTEFTAGPGPGPSYGTEAWWDGSQANQPTGQGGFGVSKYFPRPSYQSGFVTSAMRSVPDVSIHADPADGIVICQADDGGCPTGDLYGGTSLAAPEWAAFAAILNDAQGKNLGLYNTVLYPLASGDAFHSAASMGSDFAHVGLGSPNINVLNRLLLPATAGAPDATQSEVNRLFGESSTVVNTDGSFSVPADGNSSTGILVILRDANGFTLSGKTVTLKASNGSAVITPASGVTSTANGAVAFTITDLNPESVTFTATDTTDGLTLPTASIAFSTPAPTSAGISANPTTVPSDGTSTTTLVVTLTDSLKRPVPGKTIAIQAPNSHAVISGPTPVVTDANGRIQFTATDVISESATFTAYDLTDGNLSVPGPATVTFSGTSASTCNVSTAPVAGTGYAITPYITGGPAAANLYYGGANIGCPGINNPAFTSAGTVLVSDFLNGDIYKIALSGGTVSPAAVLGTVSPALGPLVYGKDGNVYATQGDASGQLVHLDPKTGAVLDVVASGLTCPAGLSVDPLSGDLFFDDQCTGGGFDDASIYRVIDPANSDPSRPKSLVKYATLPSTPNGGMAFAPDGTLYAVTGYYVSTHLGPIVAVSGTSASAVTVTPLTGITSDYAVAIGALNADGTAQSLIAEPNGVLTEFNVANPAMTTVLASVSPGVGVVGPDGCLYSQRYDTVYRLAPSSGNCKFTATSPAPNLTLTPSAISKATQGTAQTLTATVHNAKVPAGTSIIFRVNGANPFTQYVVTTADGTASFTYDGQFSGADIVNAVVTLNGTTMFSNFVTLTWLNGPHDSFATLNRSATSGTVNQPVTVTASLLDLSTNPQTVVAGQTLTFTLGSATCTAVTDANGQASCQVKPAQAGNSTLSVNYTGSSTLQATHTSVPFTTAAGATPAPTVTLSASPTSVATGSPATLTWSSTNATACVASGSWSGSEPTKGTQTVTPTSSGEYSYTLTCSGTGGSAAATAVISATLVTVTVTAKSGGGAIGWDVLIVLVMLTTVRLWTLRSQQVTASQQKTASQRATARRYPPLIALSWALLLSAGANSARADSSAPASDSSSAGSPYYIGVRAGAMPVRIDAGHIENELADRGFADVSASTHTSGAAGTLFAGYEFTAHTAVELGYTYRDATAADLKGTIPASSSVTPLLENTASLIRGYGNIVSLSYAGRFEVVPRFQLEPRLGGFFWATKVTATGPDDRVDATHEGGGITAGLSATYRLWKGLEVGVSVDHYHGFPSNIATLYAGTLEWRFGHPASP
jgi:hypothetical protein